MTTETGHLGLRAPTLYPRRFQGIGPWVWALLHRSSLDRRLAAGADPCGSSALAIRASRLTAQRTRERLAGALEDAVSEAKQPRPRFSAAVPVDRIAVLTAAPRLIQLAEILRAPEPVYAQGVAMAEQVLSDSASPLYNPGRAQALDDAIKQIIDALAGRRPAESPWMP